ncbi:fungal-specific transcription factor domain-containing protein [Aspergillus karnatakaensis]|uniref:Zn(II)2Cys6 transcription factor n=1 Tax=Aspergillus karnatakaensis TaxID=1810916 RepID=UPI003CCE4239
MSEFADTTTASHRYSRRVPDEKRKRAAQACDRCKARKSKCVGVATGRCQRCTRDDRVCKLSKYSINIRPQPPRPRPIPLGEASSQIRRGPATGVLTRADDIKPNGERFDMGNSQGMKITWPKFLLQLRETLALDPHTELNEGDMMAMQTQFHQPTVLEPNEINRIQKAARALPPKPVTDFLISVCLMHASDIFFYFDQAQFLADVDQLYTDPASPLRFDSGFICLILSVLALGSQWTELERPSSFPADLRPDGGDLGRIFFEDARSLIPDLMDRTSLTSVQAPFILGVYSLPDRAVMSAYAYMGLALRKAVALELHQQTDDSRLSECEKQIRCRLWWTVYSLERTTAIKLNRPRSIDPEVITAPPPRPLPSLDRLQPVDNVQHQIAHARLVRIIDRVADLSTGTRDSRQFEALQLELESWKRELPAALSIEHIQPKDAGYRRVFHLQLNYLYAWIVMGKGSLLNTIQAHVRDHRHDGDTTCLSSEVGFDSLGRSCVEASKMMLHLCESISHNNLVSRFSFTDFQGCSIATIVAILAGIIERDSDYDARVAFGLNYLRTMALGNVPAEVGVRFVEALRLISNEAFIKLGSVYPSEIDSPEVHQEALHAAGYSQWVQWVSSRTSRSVEQQPNIEFEVPNLSIPAKTSTTEDTRETAANVLSGRTSWPIVHQAASDTTLVDPPQTSVDTCSPQQLETDPQMIWSHDDQLTLMGLTGLDILEFDAFSHLDQF